MQCLGFRIYPCREQGANGEVARFLRRMLGVSNYKASRISAEACFRYDKDVKTREFSARDLVL